MDGNDESASLKDDVIEYNNAVAVNVIVQVGFYTRRYWFYFNGKIGY